MRKSHAIMLDIIQADLLEKKVVEEEKIKEELETFMENQASVEKTAIKKISNERLNLISHRKRKPLITSVTLLQFTDFISKSEKGRLTFVRNLKNKTNENEDGGGNHWSIFISALIKLNKGMITIDEFKKLPSTVDLLHKSNYQIAVNGYLKFLEGKKGDYSKRSAGLLELGELGIKITPHLGLIINGEKVQLMLCLRKVKPLTEKQCKQMLTLMYNSLETGSVVKYWLLDVLSGITYTENDIDQSHMPYLQREANDFIKTWNEV